MSQVYLCPRCETRVDRPPPDVKRGFCPSCGKKLNFARQPRRLGKKIASLADTPLAAIQSVPNDHVRPPSQMSERPRKPVFSSRDHRRARANFYAFPSGPGRSVWQWVAASLIGAIVIVILMIGGMLIIASMDDEPWQPDGSNESVAALDQIPPAADRVVASSNRAGAAVTVNKSRESATSNSNTRTAPASGAERSITVEIPVDVPSQTAPRQRRDSSANLPLRVTEAMALVVAEGRVGSGFCIDPRGVFVTHTGLVSGLRPGHYVKLIVEADPAGGQTYYARIARIGKKVTLLTAYADDRFAAIELAAELTIREQDEVFAVGYPYRAADQLEQGQYPAVQVNRGNVTNLIGGGDGAMVWTDAVNESAGLGGPLLNGAGEVVGVVASDDRAQQVQAASVADVHAGLLPTFARPYAPFVLSVNDLRRPFDVYLDLFSPNEKEYYATVYSPAMGIEMQMDPRGLQFHSAIELDRRVDPRTVRTMDLIFRVYEQTASGKRGRRILSLTHEIRIEADEKNKKPAVTDGKGKSQ